MHEFQTAACKSPRRRATESQLESALPLLNGELGHLGLVDAIRYYERRGVLPRASQRQSGYREFTSAAVERIRFAKTLQALGCTLQEVIEPLRAVDAGTATCESERFRVETVLGRVDEKISALRGLRKDLARTLRRCREGATAR